MSKDTLTAAELRRIHDYLRPYMRTFTAADAERLRADLAAEGVTHVRTPAGVELLATADLLGAVYMPYAPQTGPAETRLT